MALVEILRAQLDAPWKTPLLPARCVSLKLPSWEFAWHSVRDAVSFLQLMLFDGLRPALFGLGLGLRLSFAATRSSSRYFPEPARLHQD